MLSHDEAMVFAYLLDGKGHGKKLSWQEVQTWRPSDGLLWIHLNYAHDKSREWIAQQHQIPKTIQESLVLDEVRPRAVIDKDSVLIFLRGLNLNMGSDAEDMVSIRLWASKKQIITTRRRPLKSINDVQHAISVGNGPKTTSEFITMLADKLTTRIAEAIDDNNDLLDDLEDKVIAEDVTPLREKINDLRRQCLLLRKYLAPQRDALNRLVIDQTGFFTASEIIVFREALDRVQRYVEDLDSIRDRSALIQEEISTRLSEQLNSKMYLLSLVAVVFLPLTFVTGLLGINVGGIPGAADKHAFWIVLVILLGLSSLLLFIFKRKKWI